VNHLEALFELRVASEALMKAYQLLRDRGDEALARRVREVGAQVAAPIGDCRPRPVGAAEKTS
jgi:hypothetical protein